ncbi:MAG: cache domain-containing protein [Burkholderiales bacterium]|nr:cache domain-containing protein [Burkholderiales bacterium]
MGGNPPQSGAEQDDPDKTVLDPSAQIRSTSPDDERTLIDPNSPLHRGESPTVKTQIDPNSPLHQGKSAASTPDGTTPSVPSSPSPSISKTMFSGDAAARAAAYTPLPPADSLALPVGFRLYEYQIDSVLGQGGFGITYLAKDVNLDSKVAIKEYLPEDFAYRCNDRSVSARSVDDVDFYQSGLDSFLVEARTLATFRHPNIVRVARFFEAHRTAYMVLEYERGQSLKAWRKSHPAVSEKDLLTLLWPLLEGLAVVHEAGFLHRDIKPDNIYVRDEDGSLVLLDFGAARQTANARTDQTGIFTPGYGPIEQYAGVERQGPWTDIYALGATLFWLVAGKKPIEASARTGDNDPLPPAVEIGKGKYSVEFLKAIDWALKVQPEDRPRDISEFRTALYAAHASSLGLEEALRAGDERESVELKQNEGWLAALTQPKVLKAKLTKFGRALWKPASWPIAIKMSLAMVLTALLPMVITAYYNLNGSVASVSRSELRNLEQLAQSTAGRISQLLGDSRNLANYLGNDDDFLAFLKKPTEQGKLEIKSKLDGLIKANPDVQLVMVMDTTGTAVVSSDPQVMGRNFKFREYFKEAMAGRSFTTGIIVGAVAGQAGVFFANPMRDADGTVIGAVVMRILAAPISKMLDEAQSGSERVPFLVDEDGIIIHHPDPRYLFSSLQPLEKTVMDEIVADQRFRRNKIETVNMPELAKAMVGNRQGGNITYTSSISGKEEIAGYAPVLGHKWVVGVTETKEYFAAPLNQLFRTVLYSVVLVGLVFVVLALWFARSLVRPIEELESAAHALKSGDYDKANLTVRSNDEIGRLARTFNVMIDVLRQRERERGGKRPKRVSSKGAGS